ncbi:MAG: RHS repeat-associated core domain-containing protein [Bacteroidales bacterium]|nr:RHS repeat-associated core domain-containing protein [Bacteroidales bacterium]
MYSQTLAQSILGEDFVDQRTTNWAARHTFSAKEKDTETGYSYFGSRYYSSDLSIWLSVDPQSDKYPSFSPYTYCANNPIKLVDPNGEEIVITGSDGNHTYTPGSKCNSADKNVQAAWDNFNKMYQTEAGKSVIGEMAKEGSPTFTFTNESLKNDGTGRFEADGEGGGTMYMNGRLNDAHYSAHELFHGFQEMKGQGGCSIHNEVEAELFSMLTVGGGFNLSPINGLKSGDSYSDALKNFRIQCVNQNDFDENFTVLLHGFKGNSVANRDGVYQNFNLGENIPSLIKSFYK